MHEGIELIREVAQYYLQFLESRDTIDDSCSNESFNSDWFSKFLIDYIWSSEQLCDHSTDIVDVVATALWCVDPLLL